MHNRRRVGDGLRAAGCLPALRAAPLLFVLIYLIWGLNYVAVRIGLRDVAPLTLASARALVAALGLGAVALTLRRPFPSTLAAHAFIATVGLFNVSCLTSALSLGLTTVSAGEGSLLIYTQPVQVAALAALLLGERLSPRQLLGVAAGSGGVVVVLLPRVQPGATTNWWGYGVLLAGASSWAIAAVLFRWGQTTRPALARVDVIWVSALQSAYGGLPILVLAYVLEGWRFVPTFDALWILLFTGFLSAGVANLLWFSLLTRGQATVVSTCIFLVPVFAVASGALVLGEPLTLNVLVGGALTLGGIALVVWRTG